MDLSGSLSQLETAQLVRQLSDPDPAYLFRHTLTQESVYESMLRTRKMELHRQVGEVIERMSDGELEQNAAVLALHFERAGVDDKAFTFAALAGDVAARAYAQQEALMFYNRALTIGTRMGIACPGTPLRKVFANRGRVLELLGDNQAAIENYRRMIAFAQGCGNTAMEAEGLSLLLTVQGAIGHVEDAEQQLNRALELARRSGDQELVGKALWNLGLAVRFQDPERATQYFEQALEHARATELRELAAFAITDLSVEFQLLGHWHRALEFAHQALAEFRALGNKPMIANALGMASQGHFVRSEMKLARAMALEGTEISYAIENPWGIGYNEWQLMALDLEAGDFRNVFKRAEVCLAISRRLGFPPFVGMGHILMGRVYTELSRFDSAQEHFEQVQPVIDLMVTPIWRFIESGSRARLLIRRNDLVAAHQLLERLSSQEDSLRTNLWGLSFVAPSIAELALAESNPEYGVSYCTKVIEQCEKEDLWLTVAELDYLRALLYLSLGDFWRSEADLQRASDLTDESSTRLLRWQIYAGFSQLHTQKGDPAAAEGYRQRALILVLAMAETIDDPELRRSFLSRPDILRISEPLLPA